MRLRHILLLCSIVFAQCVLSSVDESGPVYTASVQQTTPAEGQLQSPLKSRDLDYRCGPNHGRCVKGTCCSSAGFCGTTKEHCRSPDCKISFGQCDAHKSPHGPPTTDIPRPHVGKVPYGPKEIRSCTVPGTVALTFDDGPTRYTGDLLDLLDRYGAKATFFITGINNGKGQIDDFNLPWASLIERMQQSGHQIASHTWSHEDLSKVTPEQRRDQLVKNEAALRNILGGFPTYMRPPYSSCRPDTGCGEELGRLGYHLILYDIDTDDYRNDSPNQIQRSKDIFDRALTSSSPHTKSWLVIAHDAHEQTVHNLTEHMLETLSSAGYRAVTVGDCLHDPRGNWLRSDDRVPPLKKTGPKKSPQQNKPASVDGTCGTNFTCLGSSFGICCGSWNTCGNTTQHCGLGCQMDAGYCSLEPPVNGDAWDPKIQPKNGPKNDADSDLRSVGTAAFTSLVLALIVAMML